MASGIYNSAKAAWANGGSNSSTATLKVALMNNTHTFDASAAVNSAWADISANEVSSAGYTAGGETLANVAVATDNTNHRVTVDGDDVVLTGVTFDVAHLVVVDTTADVLIANYDLGGVVSAAGDNVTITWAATGIYGIG